MQSQLEAAKVKFCNEEEEWKAKVCLKYYFFGYF